jgi:hypothetical protein
MQEMPREAYLEMRRGRFVRRGSETVEFYPAGMGRVEIMGFLMGGIWGLWWKGHDLMGL